MANWRRETWRRFVHITSIILVLPLATTSARAQDTATRVYLRFVGEHADDLSSASVRFQQPLLRELSIGFAGTAEMEAVYAQCAVATGTSVAEQRECELRAARRIMVDEVIEIEASEPARGTFEFVLQVWSPESNQMNHADFVEVEAESASAAVRTGLPALAWSYLCWKGREAHCTAVGAPVVADSGPGEAQVLPTTGRLEIMNVTPAPVAVLVDGREVGTAPGQFLELPLGQVEVTLRTPGYEDLTRTVNLTTERMEELNGLSLTPLPATLAVTCNVEGAEIRVDGRTEGQTRGGATVSLSLEAGRRRVTVSRSGYTSFERTLDLIAGSSSSVDVTLEVELAPEPEPTVTPRPTSSGAPGGFVRISAGSFQMGSPRSESGRDYDETQHRVTITRDFYLQAHEVTQGEWRSLMGNNPSRFSSCGDDCPVENVNWWEAVAYANALSRREGLQECYTLAGCGSTDPGEDMECSSVSFVGLDCRGYRLPTEAEWEYAARAGTTTAWYCGSSESCVGRIAWYDDNAGGRTHPVGEKAANDWGLYDMSGNVWEWVWDWYDSDYYSSSPSRDPAGPRTGQNRGHRGGSWNYFARNVRSAYRSVSAPGSRGNRFIGFRLARSAP